VLDVIIIVLIVAGAITLVLFLLNRWASKKQVGQQELIEKSKQRADIYVIDKRRDKAENVNLPKAISTQLPKLARMMKMHFVKAKIGPQIMTLMCDKRVYQHVEVKKTYKAELAGIYIVGIKGMKSAAEAKLAEKNRKLLAKDDKKKIAK
jgi:hypothetical protein